MKKSKNDDFPETPTSFDFVDDIFVKIAEKEKKQGTNSLSAPEQVLGTVWHVYGIIGNGGLFYFFEHTFDVEEVARAYESLGMRRSASILRKAIAKFPNSRKPASFKQCMKFLDDHEEFFESLSTEFWDTQTDLENILAAYIEKHPEAFSHYTS